MKTNATPIKSGSTLFLKFVIFALGIAVLAVCIFVLPNGIRLTRWNGYRPILIGMYVPTIPFFIGLRHAFKLLGFIDKNSVFSTASLHSLRIIKYCGFIISAVYAIGLPYIVTVAQQDDAPGVVLLGIIFTFAPLMLAILAAVLERLFQNAMDLKSENELTV